MRRATRSGRGRGSSRNGTTPKRIHTGIGSVDLDVPRDRNGDFEPQIVPKGRTRFDEFDDKIVALYARGMTVRDIQAHLAEMYGVDVSHDLVSRVTEGVWDEVEAWRSRPLDAVYPIVFIDALQVKIRDGIVANRPAYLAVGVDLEGRKHVLGIWIGDTDGEGASFWLGVLTELANRGVGDVLIVCCDGLAGLPDAIEATWPKATVQTCVVHLLRNSMSYAGWKDRRQIAKDLKPVYTAIDAAAAEAALDAFEAGIGARYPAIGQMWRRQWEQFTPFPELPARHPQGDLHHQHDREHQPAAPQGRQEPRPLPQRTSRHQAPLPRSAQHHHHPRRRSRHPNPRMDQMHQPARHPLPRTTPPNMTTHHPAYTEHVTLPIRRAVDKQCAFRAQHGLPPPGPPPGTGSLWDGGDPAPSRPVGAGPHRSSSRSWAALVLAAAGLPSPVGPVPAGELQRRLAAVGLCLHVRVEPYDDHDDLLHLAAVADPVRHRLLISRTEQALAAAAPS